MQYTQTELAKLIETVETEFNGFLAKSETVNTAAPLIKAEEAKPEEKKEAKPESKEEGKAEAKPEHKKEGKAEPKGEAPKAEAKPEHQEAGKEAAPHAENAENKDQAHEDEGHGYDDEDMEHMHTMYGSMSPGERKAHHDAIMKCVSAEKAPEAAPSAPMMEKSEKTEIKIEITNPETVLLKSEIEAQKAQNQELQKNLDGVKAFLTALVKKVPQGKAITSLDVVQKSETQETKQLSKAEAVTILTKKSAEPTLSKSDREAINAFCLSDANFNTISHLLK